VAVARVSLMSMAVAVGMEVMVAAIMGAVAMAAVAVARVVAVA
jgi:hypothetical protein